MKNYFLIILLQLSIIYGAISQSQTRKLPAIINHPSLNLFSPFISADGNALFFVSDNGQDGAYTVSYTSRENDWAAPVELPKHLNNRLNFLRGYALSADGKKAYVTSAKSPIIGGYDIFVSELKGSTWSNPENLMLPINSTANEACPSFTPDGKTIYFMRCDKMDMTKAEGCKLFKSTKKSNGQWEEPVELPSSINTGNSQTPRIMADGETLIFSSDKMTPNKGGMDLYLSRLKNGTWSSPVSLDFVNTERDDQYVSVSALGRYILKEAKGSRGNFELTEFLLPSDLRPKGLMKVEGKVKGDDGGIVNCYVSATELQSGKRVFSGKPAADGSFLLYLQEGSQYELSIDPDNANISYYSKLFDLRSERIPQREKVNVVLKKPVSGDEFPLDLVQFKPFSADLEPTASDELKRFSRMVKANPGMMFEIQVNLEGFKQDSVKSSPDFTETKVDTLALALPDTTLASDTAQVELEREFNRETYKTTFHNDRTFRQAETINNFLQGQGVPSSQVNFTMNAYPAAIDSSRSSVKVRIK